MKRLKRFTSLANAAILTLSSLMTLGFTGVAHAAGATVVWSGGGSDGNWSTVGNWVGGAAPTNGDIVVINNAASFTNGSTDNISGLTLDSLQFTNDGGSGSRSVLLSQNLTITNGISQASSVTTTTNSLIGTGAARTITVGSSSTFQSTAGLHIGVTGDTLSLGSNTLTFTDNGSHNNIVAVDANITGTGSVVFNGPVTDYQIGGTNTYSGTTHVIATDLPVVNTNDNSAFGTSAVTIENGASVTFDFGTNTTVSNAITVAGTTNGSPVVSLSFNNNSASGATTITIPNLTLNGRTRFANSSISATPLTINLAGIQANNFCIMYLGGGNDATNGPANGFTNGPAGCIVTAALAAPAAPDTGFALVTAHPAVTLGVTVLAAGTIFTIARRMRPATVRVNSTRRR